MSRYATRAAEATHRFPTTVHWGDGYFGDGMRYLVAATDAEALAHPSAIAAGTTPMHMQRRDHMRGWSNVARLRAS